MTDEETQPPINQATLEAALEVVYNTREHYLAAYAEQPDIPLFLKPEIDASLKQVRREKARWDKRHGQSTSQR